MQSTYSTTQSAYSNTQLTYSSTMDRATLDFAEQFAQMSPAQQDLLRATINMTATPPSIAEATSTTSPKKKRPLNSWMAFRAYYSKMFTTVQQKDISTVLTCMWQADPFHGKWQLIASVYSRIRDLVGKENVPLDQFLASVASPLSLIEPKDYMYCLNWVINEGRAVQTSPPNLESLPRYVTAPAEHLLSEADILRHVILDGVVSKGCEIIKEVDSQRDYELATSLTFNPSDALCRYTRHTLNTNPENAIAEILGTSCPYTSMHEYNPPSFEPTEMELDHLGDDYEWMGDSSALWDSENPLFGFGDMDFEQADLYDNTALDLSCPIAMDDFFGFESFENGQCPIADKELDKYSLFE